MGFTFCYVETVFHCKFWELCVNCVGLLKHFNSPRMHQSMRPQTELNACSTTQLFCGVFADKSRTEFIIWPKLTLFSAVWWSWSRHNGHYSKISILFVCNSTLNCSLFLYYVFIHYTRQGKVFRHINVVLLLQNYLGEILLHSIRSLHCAHFIFHN